MIHIDLSSRFHNSTKTGIGARGKDDGAVVVAVKLGLGEIGLNDDGEIIVDKTQKYQQEKGEWDDPESYLVV